MYDEDELIDVVDSYIGEMIERVVTKYGYDVDLAEEYYELLSYITRKLVKAWFNGRKPDASELEAKLRYIRRKYPRRLNILLSYLVSRYVRARNRYVYGLQHDSDIR